MFTVIAITTDLFLAFDFRKTENYLHYWQYHSRSSLDPNTTELFRDIFQDNVRVNLSWRCVSPNNGCPCLQNVTVNRCNSRALRNSQNIIKPSYDLNFPTGGVISISDLNSIASIVLLLSYIFSMMSVMISLRTSFQLKKKKKTFATPYVTVFNEPFSSLFKKTTIFGRCVSTRANRL